MKQPLSLSKSKISRRPENAIKMRQKVAKVRKKATNPLLLNSVTGGHEACKRDKS